MKKKILITGASGFIGRNLKESLNNDYKILSPSSKQLDLLDAKNVEDYLKKHKFDSVIHCATHNATNVSSKDLSLVFKNNLMMFFNLARCNELFDRMFYFGSGAEYDRDNYIPKMKEDYFDKHVPSDDYGFSKYVMAKYIQNFSNIYDLRLFGVFGKYEDWRIRFISNAICRVLFNKDITISKNVHFDYLYVDDLARIIKIFIEKKQLKFRYYNVCTGKRIDLKTLARIVLKVSGKQKKIVIAEKGLKQEYSGNNKRLTEQIGKFEFTKIEDAIEDLYKWYDKNQSKIDRRLL